MFVEVWEPETMPDHQECHGHLLNAKHVLFAWYVAVTAMGPVFAGLAWF